MLKRNNGAIKGKLGRSTLCRPDAILALHQPQAMDSGDVWFRGIKR